MALVGRHVRTSLAPSPLPTADLDRLRDIPTTVLSGRHDAFLPADRLATSVRKRLPAAAMRIVDDAGHLMPHERPEVVAQELEAAAAEGN
jgi:pimeloyl-ACP methyl ester carboxylesterase